MFGCPAHSFLVRIHFQCSHSVMFGCSKHLFQKWSLNPLYRYRAAGECVGAFSNFRARYFTQELVETKNRAKRELMFDFRSTNITSNSNWTEYIPPPRPGCPLIEIHLPLQNSRFFFAFCIFLPMSSILLCYTEFGEVNQFLDPNIQASVRKSWCDTTFVLLIIRILLSGFNICVCVSPGASRSFYQSIQTAFITLSAAVSC